MAIEILKSPLQGGKQTIGPLTLPDEFDETKFAAKWVKKGPAVQSAAVREHIPGTRITADGWLVWKANAGGKPHTVMLNSGEHILLCRPREIQTAVNAICGNVGKERMMDERIGNTVAGVPVEDPGILGDDRLNRIIGSDPLMQEDGGVVLNKIDVGERVITPPLEAGLA